MNNVEDLFSSQFIQAPNNSLHPQKAFRQIVR